LDAAVHAESLCLPALRRAGFREPAARTAAFHCLAVDLFGSDMIGHYQPRLGALGRCLPVDARSEALHFGSLFDTAAVVDAWRFLERRAAMVLADGDAEWRLAALGAILHAVHDFYSHSNWPLLDWTRLGYVTPTWDDLPSALRAGLDLHTAAGHGVRPPAGRFAHHQLNADHPGRPGHATALRCAARATEQWLAKARGWCGAAWPLMQRYGPAPERELAAVSRLARAVGHWSGPAVPRPDLAVAGLVGIALSLRGSAAGQWTRRRLGRALTAR